MRSYARETMATKMADGRVKIYEKFKTRIELTGAATLRMNNVEMSDETIYCCEVHYSSKSAMSCVQAFVLGKKTLCTLYIQYFKVVLLIIASFSLCCVYMIVSGELFLSI